MASAVSNLAEGIHKIKCKNEYDWALKELQSDISITVLPGDKGRYTAILNRQNYLEKFMDHINNGPYQLLKKTFLLSKSKPRHWNN